MGKKSVLSAFFALASLLSWAQESAMPEEPSEGGAASGQTERTSSNSDQTAAAALLAVPVLPVEAPQSLLSLKIGDSDVELTAQGYWEAGVTASGAVGFGANSGASAPALLFRQSPDLWLSLVLMDRWFVEARLSADGTEDGYAAGYRGGEGDFLKEVRIGNRGVDFPELPYLSLGAGTSSSFGLSAYGKNDAGSAHFLVRYDQARRVTQTWSGDKELTRTEFKPADYVRGKWFWLPDTGFDASALELYIENSSGTFIGSDLRKYRKMAADEYAVSSATGRLDLGQKVDKDRRLLVYYPGMTVPVPPGTDAAPFYGRPPAAVTVDSAGAMVLYEEGEQEGFLIANRYRVPSSASSASAYVEVTATGLKDSPGYTATVLSSGYVEVVKGDADDPRSMAYSHPFLNEVAAYAMDWVYDPKATTEAAAGAAIDKPAPAYSKIVVLESYGASGDLVLEDDEILAGSLEVRRNGVRDYDFTYDEPSRTVKLDREPGPSETIEISYLLASSDRSAGSLAAALGGVFNLSPEWKAWTALGLRWGVPGTGYSEAGQATPGTLTLTAGASGGTPEAGKGQPPAPETFRAQAALAASYNREDAVGYYRAAGMEETASWKSPFRPTSSWPTGAYVQAIGDAALASLFPDTCKRFHSAVSTQKALEIAFDGTGTGATAELVRYVDPITVGNYKTFAFFARRAADASMGYSTSESAATLTISISGSSDAISVAVPMTYVKTTWRRFLVRYDGIVHLYYQDEEDGTETLVASVTPEAHPDVSGGKISIAVSGVTAGNVYVDELYFQDPAGEFSLSGRGKIEWGRTGPVASVSGRTVLSDPHVSGSLSGTVSEDSAAAAYLDGKIGVGPFRVSLSAQQGLSDGAFTDGAFAHGVELPLKNLQIADAFEYAPYTGRFGRRDRIAFKAGWFALKLDQESSYANKALEQDWKLDMRAGNAFSLTTSLENKASGSLDLSSGYGGAWLESWKYLLPALESSSDSRDTDLSAFLKVKGALLSFSASAGLLNAASSSPMATDEAQLRFGWSIPVGRGAVEPYYKRTWSLESVAASASFAKDWGFWAESFGEAEYLYRSVPFLELWDGKTADSFTAAVLGSKSAEYHPEAGVAVSRRYGSRWTDLLVPSKGTIALRRELESDLDTVTDALVGELTASASAVNLFGARGAYRLSRRYSVDEYSQRLSAEVAYYRQDGAVLTTLTHKALAAFYTDRDDSLVADNRVAVTETRDGASWSEQLALTLTTRPQRTWLGDLAAKILDKPAKEDSVAASDRPNAVSGYLSSVKGAPRRLSESWELTALIKRPYAYLNRYDLELTESYEAKVVSPNRLSVSASLDPYQKVIVKSGLWYWTIGLDLTVTLKVMF